MRIYSKLISTDTINLKEAIEKIDQGGKRILFLSDAHGKLVGSLSDGDVRRWILSSRSLDVSVKEVMNHKPLYLNTYEKAKAYEMMTRYRIDSVPLLNEEGQLTEIIFWDEFADYPNRKYGTLDIPVVIMAGGFGTRLYPYTKILPKPLIPIGDTPIVERIMNRFAEYGCSRFYLTVNYKKNMIRSYFADLLPEYDICYVEEDTPLGTAGSLHLLEGKIEETFFLSNCDILVDSDYSSIYRYHKEKNNKITMVTSLKQYTIPYGVVQIDKESTVIAIDEKPESYVLVNTGVYLVEPELIAMIPKGRKYHITELIELCIHQNMKVGTYPISEGSWLDMGQFSEMDRMIERLEVKECKDLYRK